MYLNLAEFVNVGVPVHTIDTARRRSFAEASPRESPKISQKVQRFVPSALHTGHRRNINSRSVGFFGRNLPTVSESFQTNTILAAPFSSNDVTDELSGNDVTLAESVVQTQSRN